MNKSDMLECLINHYTDGNKAKFAQLLGVKPQTVSAWVTRNTYDAELLYAKCRGVSAVWLLSGEGDMLSAQQNAEHEPRKQEQQSQELLKLCKILVANYQQRDEVMNKLVSMIGK